MKIHHNTLKKAAKFGITLEARGHGDKWDAFKGDEVLAQAFNPKDALDLAIRALKGDGDGEGEGEGDGEGDGEGEGEGDGEGDGEGGGDEAELSDAELDTDEADEDGEPERSVVKAKYRAKYRPNKGHCGDDLAVRLRDEFMTKQDPDTGKPRLDFKAFVEFAKANEVWVDSYRSLRDRHGNRNDGLIRMNCANRLRAKVRKGHKIVW